MKRKIYIMCIICLLFTLVGCGRERVSGGAEDLPYPVSWQERRENTYWVTIHGDAPEGYGWACESSGIVTTKGPTEKKRGTVFAVSGEEVGYGEAVFSLVSTDGLEHTCYTFTMNFVVEPDSSLTVESYSYFEAGALQTFGSEESPVYAAQTENGLQLTVDGMWTYTHENDHITAEGSTDGGKLTLLLNRMDDMLIVSETYEQSVALAAEAAEAGDGTEEAETAGTETAETPTVSDLQQEYYKAQSDKLTLTSRDLGIVYEMTLQMAEDGTITVQSCEEVPLVDENTVVAPIVTEEEAEEMLKELQEKHLQEQKAAKQLEKELEKLYEAQQKELANGGTGNEN